MNETVRVSHELGSSVASWAVSRPIGLVFPPVCGIFSYWAGVRLLGWFWNVWLFVADIMYLVGGMEEFSYDYTSMVCIKVTVGLVVSLHCWQDVTFTVPAKYAASKHIRESLAQQ